MRQLAGYPGPVGLKGSCFLRPRSVGSKPKLSQMRYENNFFHFQPLLVLIRADNLKLIIYKIHRFTVEHTVSLTTCQKVDVNIAPFHL